MALHTGQHMLSAALAKIAGAATVSARLGAETSTIDVESVDEKAIRQAEELVDEVVLDDRPIHILFPTADDAQMVSLSSERRRAGAFQLQKAGLQNAALRFG